VDHCSLLTAHSTLPPHILEAEDQDMLEEERRIFYVALTRAKDELYITYPMTCLAIADRRRRV
jgi:superfamily I DNA/RNA helicase